ncbi:MAG TPA: enoyl-CoA hydratase-related protein [Thermoleophilaceae bacterium]|nr:enoyl-CoA hydratase-related protein [Thermoleophilaceae bacterium]
MSYETVIWDVEDGVGRITLNRPDSLNAWNEQLGLDLRQVVTGDAQDDAVRAVLITGAGRGFSSGADLKEGGAGEVADDGLPDVRKRLNEIYHPILIGLREMPKPAVAAVNGPAVGIGASLAFACDLIVASSSAYFNLAFVNIGLMPDGGSTAFVPAAVGKARAFRMAMLGERIPAQQALDWGLINEVVEPESLPAASLGLAQRLAHGPTRSYAGTKRALNRILYGDLNAQLELEADIQHELFRTNDVREGVTAFIQKREPSFTGS